ncbi:DNA transposase THAP9 [Merluccius polli]|uniref:DNA transposase THAP9 n=1 Tax=Merluccius polli TaxID=89951 RepID=A0AA47MRY6_MERPO|nr:DNA transposase THAP9 [Merluccius polli]
MPDFCAAYGCSNERNNKTKEKGITFHRFPSNVERRQAWTQALRREGFVPCPRSLLCSSHFRSLDFDRTGQTVRLRESAVPSIFNFPKHLSKLPCLRTSRTATKAGELCPPPPPPAKEPDFFDQPATDHLYFLDPEKTKKNLTECQDQVEKLRRELRNARDREKRQKKTVQCLLDDLTNKNMLSEELQQKLDFYSDLPVEFLKTDHAFTSKQREFALTLHLHGPKAYKYLREQMKIPLPHPHTLLKWLHTVDAKPGLNTSLLDLLQRKSLEDHDQFGQVCLMLDGMSIRKQVLYDAHTGTMRGFVDIGMGVDETTEASEALVFMVVGLKSHWKMPVAFYFIKSVSPDTQKILVLHALEALHERGIKVVCVTMDGHISNMSMCAMLGCQLKLNQPLKTYFTHPSSGENVYIIMDPCHMLKLARNMLEAYSSIVSPAGTVSVCDWLCHQY